MEVREDLTMEVQPVQIMDRSIKELQNKKVLLVKVLWTNSQIEEETWERESEMMKKYPRLFPYIGMNLISRMKFFLGGENVKPLGEKL
jgi:hypothetical protein